MSISFKAIAKKNPQSPTEPLRFYASAVSGKNVDIDELAKLIADNSTVSRADTYAVIISMLEQIMKDLAAGRSVVLGKLGKFSISLHSEGAATAEELTSAQIKKATINYRPGNELKDMLAILKFEKV
ncbi:MAG: DNA-binding protein [Bacteroidetes bacterium HGW-Bacteroidetes-17]|jgi:predicted histone-like DNA-binding protein|nr:MAG: DNA-binding protein [Bacteroidetes bacterium HGW-Bacteroidetes-17]